MQSQQLIQSLHAVRRQVRGLAVLRGVGLLLAAVVAIGMGVVLFDYLLNLPAWPRVILMSFAGVVILVAAARWVLRPARLPFGVADVADRLETVFPRFEDRLRSAVAFSTAEVPGSPLLKQRVIEQAGTMAAGVDFRRAVVARPAVLSILAGIAAMLTVLAVGYFATPTHASIALSRLISPFAEHAWPKKQRIDLIGEVPTRLPAGQRLELKMRLGHGDRSSLKAIVLSQLGDGAVQQQLMQRGPDGAYTAAVDTQAGDADGNLPLKLWIKSGDDEKQIPVVTVVRRLAIERVQAVLSPPPYVTGAAPQTLNLAAAPAVAGFGSNVKLLVSFNKPLVGDVRLEPVTEGAQPQAPPTGLTQQGEGAARALSFPATASLRFRLRGVDEDGFANAGVEEYELIVRPDQTPSIQIEHPRRNEERTAVAVVPLEAVAEDDYGLRDVTLVVERLADKKVWEIPLVADGKAASESVGFGRVDPTGAAASDRLRYRLAWAWELSQLPDAQLKSGDVLEFFLRATDNFYLDGKQHDPVQSGRLRVTIISQEELTARIMDDLRFARGQIGEVDKAQTRVRTETTELTGETKDKESLDLADRTAAERLANQQSTAASQAKQLAGRLATIRERLEQNRSERADLGDLARDVSDLLTRAAEGAMKDAAQQLNSANQQASAKQERNAALDRAQSAQAAANQQLQGAMDRLGDLGGLAQSIENVQRLLDEQRKLTEELAKIGRDNLGKKPEQMPAGERQKLNDLAARQAKLAGRTAAAIAEMQKQADAMVKTDPASSSAMKEAAAAGQQQQVSPNQQKAAQAARQNQQSSANSAQKQAELGLQQMLKNLRDAERRKLAELQKQLADLQKQIQNLIRRQAGHNLDNVALQGPDRFAAIDARLMGELLARAQRKPDALPPVPTAAQLSGGQEQTERNTRDIARAAEAMPNAGAEVASRLTRAAGRMERANVLIRQSDLPAAYDPPQVEALAALEEARRQVDELKKQVDAKIEKEKRELIRAAYTRIREAQVKVNEETTRIDGVATRDGRLKREELIRLGQLPGEQGKLADEIKSLEERLEALGSIVYVWANTDIARSMNQVKARLGDRRTDRPTQVEQARVVRQLEQMIESLQENPIDSQFAQDGGGAGGGQNESRPRLPAEAELRLLKGLQSAVNDATAEMNEAAPRDEAAVRALGGRQGEMRQLLAELLEKSSEGKIALGPEPDPRDKPPEDAGNDQPADDALMKDLLAGDAGNDADARQAQRVGHRMGRARQRLATDLDPGQTTQLIQKRILDDMDVLIEQSRRQQAQARNSDQQQGEQSEAQTKRQPRPGEQQAQADNQGGQQQQQQGTNPAEQSANAGGGGGRDREKAGDIKETLREWGGLSPRQRDAVIEGSSETVIEAYKRLVEDYYKSLATKATEKQ